MLAQPAQLALTKDCGKGTALSTRDRSKRAAHGAAAAGASAAAWPDLVRAASKPPSTACCLRGRLPGSEGDEEGGEGFAACGGLAFVRDTLRSTTASGCSAQRATSGSGSGSGSSFGLGSGSGSDKTAW